MNANALGVEVSISGKLRSERAHFEKHSAGIIPKSGDVAERTVSRGVTHVLTKMGLMGIQLKIALKNGVPQEFELSSSDNEITNPNVSATTEESSTSISPPDDALHKPTENEKVVAAGGNANGQS